MQESINQQKALQASFSETLDCLQDQLSTFIQRFEEPLEGQPMRQSVKKDFKHVPSLPSLNASLNTSLNE